MLDDLPELLTVQEAAKVLRLSLAGMRKLLVEGKVRGTKIGKRWVVRKDEVLRVIEQGTEPIELAGGRQHPRSVPQPDPDDDDPGPVERAAPASGGRHMSFDGAPVPRLRVIG